MTDARTNGALTLGQYVSYKDRGKTRYGIVAEFDQAGRPLLQGCLAEDIPAGTLVQPATSNGAAFVPAAAKARPFTPPPRFDSGVPCANRVGQPVVVSPQCDASKNAESLLRTSPAFGTDTSAHREALGQAHAAMGSGDLAGFAAAMQAAMDIRDFPLCRDCARAFFMGGASKGDAVASRSGMLHSMRPDV